MSIRKRTWKSNGSRTNSVGCDYRDQHGKRRLKTFTLKKDAEAWAPRPARGLTRPPCTERQDHDRGTSPLGSRIAGTKGSSDRHDRTARTAFTSSCCSVHWPREAGNTDDAAPPRLSAQLRDAGRSVAMRRKI